MLILYFLHLIPLQGAAQYQAVKQTNLFSKETYVYRRYLQNVDLAEGIKLVKQEHSLLVKAIDFQPGLFLPSYSLDSYYPYQPDNAYDCNHHFFFCMIRFSQE